MTIITKLLVLVNKTIVCLYLWTQQYWTLYEVGKILQNIGNNICM